uniref:Uncharacterized protein n=1 Tax=Arion vulgaris TaxID=1028688 RepID=A0A0B6ZLM4_9EUPU
MMNVRVGVNQGVRVLALKVLITSQLTRLSPDESTADRTLVKVDKHPRKAVLANTTTYIHRTGHIV